jgi:hypothetical protein
MKRSALAIAIVLSLAACSVESNPTATTATTAVVAGESTSTTAQPATTSEDIGGETSTSTTSEVSDPPPPVDGPAAPDFTFALADGSTFSLSGEQKPVYLVFWAEW